MSSMRDPLEHHHLAGNKLASTQHAALAMASSLQPLARAGDSKHRLEVHTVSDTSSPESAGKKRVQMLDASLVSGSAQTARGGGGGWLHLTRSH